MVEFKQELPPPGGYSRLNITRIPPAVWGVGVKLSIYLTLTAIGFYIFRNTKERMKLEKIEMRCAKIALYPLLEAESDRMFLKQLKKNRDDEERVMRNVEGWEVGKWKHYPVYLTLGPDEYFKPSSEEYFAHSAPHTGIKLYNIARDY